MMTRTIRDSLPRFSLLHPFHDLVCQIRKKLCSDQSHAQVLPQAANGDNTSTSHDRRPGVLPIARSARCARSLPSTSHRQPGLERCLAMAIVRMCDAWAQKGVYRSTPKPLWTRPRPPGDRANAQLRDVANPCTQAGPWFPGQRG
jgi:hypothetical protein